MSKNKLLLAIVLIILIVAFIAIGIWIGSRLVQSNAQDASGSSPYVAVYMTSGDVYFGKITWFPFPRLTDVWVLQKGTAVNGQSQVGVLPFQSAFWGPVDAMNLNMSQVLFWTNLRNNSQVVPALENPNALFGPSVASTTTQ